MRADTICTSCADVFDGTKPSFWFNPTEQNAAAQRAVPRSLLSAFSEAQPEYQIPEMLPQVSTCRFAFADWDFEERFPPNKESNGNWAKVDKHEWKAMLKTHVSCHPRLLSLTVSNLVPVLQQICCLSINSVRNDNSTNVFNTTHCLCVAQREF